MAFRTIEEQQYEICKQYGAEFVESAMHLKAGVADNVRDFIQPLNGLRHPPEGDTTGWYIWAGEEFSERADFFKPLHIEHIEDYCPQAQKFLGLAPGWRFLVAGEYVDVWFDASLLDV